MLKVKALQSNLVIVEVLRDTTTTPGGIIFNTKKEQTLAKVINTGELKVFPDVVKDSLILVDTKMLEQSSKIDRIFDFAEPQKEYRLIDEYMIKMVVEQEVVDQVEEKLKNDSTLQS